MEGLGHMPIMPISEQIFNHDGHSHMFNLTLLVCLNPLIFISYFDYYLEFHLKHCFIQLSLNPNHFKSLRQ